MLKKEEESEKNPDKPLFDFWLLGKYNHDKHNIVSQNKVEKVKRRKCKGEEGSQDSIL